MAPPFERVEFFLDAAAADGAHKNASPLPPLFVQSWRRPLMGDHRDTPAKHLIFVHGLNDYGGRFERSVGRFVDAGFTVWAPDLYGHGRSRDDGRVRADCADHCGCIL